MSVQAPPLSFSRLNAYHRCALAYRLRYVDQVPQEASGALIGGRAVHKVIEHSEAQGWWNDPAQFEEPSGQALEFFRAELAVSLSEAGDVRWAGRKTREFPNGEDGAWWDRQGRFMLRRYHETRTSDLAGLSLVDGGSEMFVGLSLPSGQYVRGYIDAFLASDENGEGVVVDYSTGRIGGKSPLQFATYARLLAEPGFDVRRGVAVYLRAADAARRLQWLDLAPLVPLVDEMYDTLASQIAQGVYPINPDGFHSSCSVRAHCDYWRALIASGAAEERDA